LVGDADATIPGEGHLPQAGDGPQEVVDGELDGRGAPQYGRRGRRKLPELDRPELRLSDVLQDPVVDGGLRQLAPRVVLATGCEQAAREQLAGVLVGGSGSAVSLSPMACGGQSNSQSTARQHPVAQPLHQCKGEAVVGAPGLHGMSQRLGVSQEALHEGRALGGLHPPRSAPG